MNLSPLLPALEIRESSGTVESAGIERDGYFRDRLGRGHPRTDACAGHLEPPQGAEAAAHPHAGLRKHSIRADFDGCHYVRNRLVLRPDWHSGSEESAWFGRLRRVGRGSFLDLRDRLVCWDAAAQVIAPTPRRIHGRTSKPVTTKVVRLGERIASD